jgi:hypothetical protein
MATSFTWKIVQLERQTADGYVFTVHYTVFAEDGTYSASSYGSVGLERGDTLIPYSDLTEDIVVDWLQNALGKDQVTAICNALQAQIDEQAAPTKVSGLPWSNNSAV